VVWHADCNYTERLRNKPKPNAVEMAQATNPDGTGKRRASNVIAEEEEI